MLVVDAPGWADASTAWLAQGSQLTVLPTGASVDDLNPTIRLMHELMGKGIADWRAGAGAVPRPQRCRGGLRRDYLRQANYKALKGELREKKAFADLQNIGQAVTEGPAALSREAIELVEHPCRARARAEEGEGGARARGPARLVRSS